MPKRKALELESVVFAMVAAVPLYVTGAVFPVAVAAFHLMMALIALRVWLGRSPLEVPVQVLGIVGVLYLMFFPVDVLIISRSLIRSSAHLLFFIACYQVLESTWRDNGGQRILVTFLIFVTSVATSTHLTVVGFILLFTFLVFRQLMHLSYQKTMNQTGQEYAEASTSLGAVSYVFPTIVVASLLFPMLPRLHSPFVDGLSSPLDRRATGISDTIDLRQERTVANDEAVVARVWMDGESLRYFAPIRLKAAVYDDFWDGEWRQSRHGDQRWSEPSRLDDSYLLAESVGATGEAEVQQRSTSEARLYAPAGTTRIDGLRFLFRRNDQLYALDLSQGPVTYTAQLGQSILAAPGEEPDTPGFPVSREVAALANTVAAGAAGSPEIAAAFENYLIQNFEYVANVGDQGRPISVDEFLLTERRGHCEYFAAGMVGLLTARGIPARIVGGFYGGRFNPLTGYYTLRRSDAHAWVEMFDGEKWVTFDPTPPSLRPGTGSSGFVKAYLEAVAESITYYWDRYVLTFGLRDQMELFVDVFTRVRELVAASKVRIRAMADSLPAVALVSLLMVGFALVFYLWRNIPRPRGLFEEMVHRLRALEIEVDPSMTVEELLTVLRRERPEIAGTVAPIVRAYSIEAFSPRHASEPMMLAARRALSQLREAE